MSQHAQPEAGGKPSPYALLFTAAAVFVAINCFSLLSPIIFSFLLVVFVSLAVNPVVGRIRTLTGGRRSAAGLFTVGFVLLLVLAGWAFLVPLQSSVSKIGEKFPQYWASIQKPLIKMEREAGVSEEKLQAEVTEERADAGQRPAAGHEAPKHASEMGTLRTGLIHVLQGLAGGFKNIAINATQMLLVLVTVFFGVLFTLLNPRPIFRGLLSLVPERHHATALSIVHRVSQFVPRWALATALAMLAVGTLVFLVMLPLFGFPDALVLGLIAGVFEAVPYVGPLLSMVPALLMAFGDGGNTPLWVFAAFLVVQLLEHNAIGPLLVAGSMKLHPVQVIFTMLLCVTAFGVLGVLIAAPTAAIVNILYDELFRKRLIPTTTEEDLDRLARAALNEKQRAGDAPAGNRSERAPAMKENAVLR